MPLEFALRYREVAEAFDAWRKGYSTDPELADVVIYAAGLAEILGCDLDLDAEVDRKLAMNEARRYESQANGRCPHPWARGRAPSRIRRAQTWRPPFP